MWWLVVSVVKLVWTLDSFTKSIATRNLRLGEGRKHLGGSLVLTNVRNSGGFNGILSERPCLLKIASILILIKGFVFAHREAHAESDDTPCKYWVFYGMFLGGALANVVERLRRGYVTDFVQLRCRRTGGATPIFNLADVFIVLGIIGLSIIRIKKCFKRLSNR